MTDSEPDKTKVQVSTNIFLQIVYPNLLYSVQNRLRNLGIHFIDLNTGFIVKGNINIDTLGMISKKSFKKTKRVRSNVNHFLIPPEINKVYDVEATINIFEPKEANAQTIFTIQVVDENHLDFWQDIFTEIGQKFLYQIPSGPINSEVVFRIVPLTLPDPKDSVSATNAMLGNIQRYQKPGRSNLDQLPGYARPKRQNPKQK